MKFPRTNEPVHSIKDLVAVGVQTRSSSWPYAPEAGHVVNEPQDHPYQIGPINGSRAETVIRNHTVKLNLEGRSRSGLKVSIAIVFTIGVAATVAVAVQIDFV